MSSLRSQKKLLQQIQEGQQINANARAKNLLAFLNLLDAPRFHGEQTGVNRRQGRSRHTGER